MKPKTEMCRRHSITPSLIPSRRMEEPRYCDAAPHADHQSEIQDCLPKGDGSSHPGVITHGLKGSAHVDWGMSLGRFYSRRVLAKVEWPPTPPDSFKNTTKQVSLAPCSCSYLRVL